MNEPVITPPVIVYVRLVMMLAPPTRVTLASPVLKPVPEKVIVSPPLPLVGENTRRGLVTVNPVENVVCTTNVVMVTAYGLTGAAAATVKAPVRSPFTSMMQLAGFAPLANSTAAGNEVVPALQSVPAPPPVMKPEPVIVTAVLRPPLLGVRIKVDVSKKSATEVSPVWPVNVRT
jgi:hypothetical protein